MGKGEVRRKNRPGVAENQVFAPVENPFLYFREVIDAQKASPLVSDFYTDVGQAVLDSSGVVLEANGKSSAGEGALPDVFQRLTAFPEIEPCLLLLRQQLDTESGEALQTSLSVEGGISFFAEDGCEMPPVHFHFV